MNAPHTAALAEIEQLERDTPLTESEFDLLEATLRAHAACLHWTGDPLKQPPSVVLACVKWVLARRGTVPEAKPQVDILNQFSVP